MGRILSGVQPTGNLHLGNYLGAIKNWVQLQHQDQALFCIVDLHAITVPQDPKHLRESTIITAATYIASGIDPNKSIIFQQSAVPEHAELAWLLSTMTPLGWLNRMTQFKEKLQKDADSADDSASIEKANLGLYAYPVLMAADILLYQATKVPVGHDQKQHLELARDLAGVFNRAYKKYVEKPFFILPEPVIMGSATRVMSLKDGTKKMSKSEVSDLSRINLTDNADQILQKIKKAKTDAIVGVSYDVVARPEVSNLINILAAITNNDVKTIEQSYQNHSMADFKQILADALIAHLTPISQKINYLLQDKAEILAMLRRGVEGARQISTPNMNKIKEIMGFVAGGL